MSGTDDLPTGKLEAKLRRSLRVITGFVFLILVVVLSLADTFGAGVVRVSEFIFGCIMGGLLLIGGVEGGSRIASLIGGRKHE